MNRAIFISVIFAVCFTISLTQFCGNPQLSQLYCASNVTNETLAKVAACDQFMPPEWINDTNTCLQNLNSSTTIFDRRNAQCNPTTKEQLTNCMRDSRQKRFGGPKMARNGRGGMGPNGMGGNGTANATGNVGSNGIRRGPPGGKGRGGPGGPRGPGGRGGPPRNQYEDCVKKALM